MNILFVCTGNICRSPAGEAVLRRMADAAGLGDAVTIESCGTHAYHIGQPPDARARRAGERRGYDFAGQRARQVSISDFDRFDLILAMAAGISTGCGGRPRPGAATGSAGFSISRRIPGGATCPIPTMAARRTTIWRST